MGGDGPSSSACAAAFGACDAFPLGTHFASPLTPRSPLPAPTPAPEPAPAPACAAAPLRACSPPLHAARAKSDVERLLLLDGGDPSPPPPPDDDDLSLLLYKSDTTRREAVSKALKATIGPLALAFACQGNWLMRRQVLVLGRDGRSRIDNEALAEAAAILRGAAARGAPLRASCGTPSSSGTRCRRRPPAT